MEDTLLLEYVRKLMHIKNPLIKEFLAEFLGTFILMMFGDGSVAQSVLTGQANGDVFSINWGWAVAVMLAVLVSGGVSGGHVNPAVSLAMAVWGKFPWAKVPIYMVAQYLGAFFASVLLYGVYLNALDNFDPGRTDLTAGIWATYPGVALLNGTNESTAFLSAGNGMSDQIVGTMLLLICVCAITDPRNMQVPKALVPFFVGMTVLNIGICFGFNCGYAINPARDLGPRIFTLIAGWGDHPFTAMTVDSVAWWWIPIIGPHIGAIIGVFVYLVFIELHHTEAAEFNLPQVQSQDSVASPGLDGKYTTKNKILA
ncbi:unnamed protein product [Meganyctiphanes norvegica]|uniref:Aquaporin-3 n=1 Tax=Meganyctiphanes norvegica TaxID=48144 RepID=A0AAV2PQI7_MEGNR